MPSVTLHTSPAPNMTLSTANPLPTLLQTPSGLALLEIQGTIHAPFSTSDSDTETNDDSASLKHVTDIGRLEFPLYDPSSPPTDDKWMKKVYFYVGKHQRLVGEVKNLGRAMAVVRKREERRRDWKEKEEEGEEEEEGATEWGGGEGRENGEELEIAEIVKFKVVFGGRPEPVGGEMEGGV